MIAHFKGGPVGLNTLAAAVGESENTISDVYEPHLLRQGLIQRTPRGRVVTERGWVHLGLEASSVTALLTLYPESESGPSGQ
jgi:Holliday junction DNA helicase RuvB